MSENNKKKIKNIFEREKELEKVLKENLSEMGYKTIMKLKEMFNEPTCSILDNMISGAKKIIKDEELLKINKIKRRIKGYDKN